MCCMPARAQEMIFWAGLICPRPMIVEEFARIKQAAKKIQQTCEVLVGIGIGGSYLGARAAIEFVNGQMYNGVRPEGIPEVYFVGNNISSSYLNDIVKIIGNRDFGINVISKSGTTTEPAIAFRIFKKLIEEKYGREGAKERIFATTDKARGALKKLADDEGYETFVVPDDVGGRFSVLTAVGLVADGRRGRGYRRGDGRRGRGAPEFCGWHGACLRAIRGAAQHPASERQKHGDFGQLRARACHARRMVQAAVR